MLKPNAQESKTDLETDGRVVIVQKTIAAPPVTITRDNCETALGLSPKRFARLVRDLRIAAVMTPGGPMVLRTELEAAMRAHARVLGEAAASGASSNDGDLDLSAAAAAAGLKLVGGRHGS